MPHSEAETKWTRYPQTIDAGYYAAIGEVCARWAWLEFQLGVIARETLGINKPEGFAITGGMSMRSVTTVLLALTLGGLPKNRPELRNAINALATKLNKIGDMRNQYAHALWPYEKPGNPQLGIVRFKTPEDRNSLKWLKKTINEIKQDAEFLAALQVTAQDLTDALKGRPSKYP
jgi:hypothetical protein